MHLINTIVCSICVMYTMLGGLKAVVWTDVLQNFIMFFALLFITYIGVTEVGSFKETFSRASDIGIFEVNTNLDLTSKNTLWNCFLSGVLLFTCLIGFNQSCVQRIVSLPTIKDSRKAIILFFIGFIITVSIVCILAVVMAAFFNDCDPLKSGEINQSDNILSYFVQKLSINTRGIQGMYMACVVCASLSTISANINSLSCTLYKDCIKPFIPNSKNNNLIPKIIALLSGVFLICSGFVVEILNSTAIQIITTSLNLVFSTYASTFMLGFLAPRIHSRAMFLSNIVGFIVILGVIVKGQFFSGRFQYEPIEKTFSTDCLNSTVSSVETNYPGEYEFFKMSYFWYLVFGTMFIWVLAEVLSIFIKSEDIKIRDPKLFAPWMRKSMKNKKIFDEDLKEPLKVVNKMKIYI